MKSGRVAFCLLLDEFDDARARLFGTPAETALDLKSDNVAFADAVTQEE